MIKYYSEKDYWAAHKKYEKAKTEADRVAAEVFSLKMGEWPKRIITEEDIIIMDKREKAWQKFLEVARRPSQPK